MVNSYRMSYIISICAGIFIKTVFSMNSFKKKISFYIKYLIFRKNTADMRIKCLSSLQNDPCTCGHNHVLSHIQGDSLIKVLGLLVLLAVCMCQVLIRPVCGCTCPCVCKHDQSDPAALTDHTFYMVQNSLRVVRQLGKIVTESFDKGVHALTFSYCSPHNAIGTIAVGHSGFECTSRS